MAKNMLHRKLIRDMRLSGMQFIALILLCVLGTFLYAGIDGVSRMADATNRKYFRENNLADFWVSLPAVDRQALNEARAVKGVKEVCARFSYDMETTLPGEPTLNVTAYDGAMTVNTPTVVEGQGLMLNDRRGCLMQEGFAREHGISVGDSVTVRFGETEYELTVRGISYSPEFISVSDDFAANPQTYGYVLANAGAFPTIPLSQMAVRLEDGADQAAAREEITRRLPAAFVQDHKSHRSTATAEDNVTMFHSLSIVFPMAAFLVAALIVMTTLTRMIDNQRLQIGTLRALGFSHTAIRWHYLCYALFPSLIGSVLGAVLGHATLPALIWALLIGQNEYPYRVLPPISLPAWIMVGVSVLAAVVICLSTYAKAERESAADLLRPKPPKAGRRNLLERIAPLWRRLRFNSKMVVRNLMRSRSRTVMSCVGLVCCCALLIASMGLQDSVYATVYNHFGKTLRYDLRVRLNQKAGLSSAYQERVQARRVECAMEKSVFLDTGTESRTTLLTVIQDDQRLMYLGEKESYLALPNGQAALTEKLARTLGVKVGQTLRFRLAGDDESFSLVVGELVYNNFFQGVYMNEATWAGLRKGAFQPTMLLVKGPTAEGLARIAKMDEADKADTIQAQAQEALISFQTVSSVFMLLVVIALAMAFLICYNMGLINFAERTREYATLKVLGYHQSEIRWLILKENMIVAFVALVLAVGPGLLLTDVILRVVETDGIRYVSSVSFKSVAYSCLITFAFSILIQLLLVRKVRSIVMVEALKSVE